VLKASGGAIAVTVHVFIASPAALRAHLEKLGASLTNLEK